MKRSTSVLLATLAVAVLSASALPATVLASHEPASTDYTVSPSNPSPGAADVSYTLEAELTDNFGDARSGFAEVTDATFSLSAGNVTGCSGGFLQQPATLSVTEGGGQTEFEEYEGSFSGGTADFDVSDPDKDYKVGETLQLDLSECVGNPDSAGWYRADLTVQGTAFGDNSSIQLDATSHYFAICEGCDNESAARDELGPPPSEPTPTPTPEPTASPTPTPTADPTPTPTDEPDAGSTATPTAGSGGDGTATPTPTAISQNGTPTATPTPADGPSDGGFFGLDPMLVVAVVAAVSIGIAAFGASRL